MATTYSTNLRLALMATGENEGTWGTTTNTNLGTLLEQAIVGVGVVPMGDADQTITIPDGASGTGRCLVVRLTGVLSATRTLTVPTVSKNYVISNETTGGQDVIVQTATPTTTSVVSSGYKKMLYVQGNAVIDLFDNFDELTVDNDLTVNGSSAFGDITVNSVNKLHITAPATTATLVIANNKTFTVSNTLTLAGTDSTTFTFPSTTGAVITDTATQTMTNKTLTNPALTLPTIGGTGANFAGSTSGTINVVATAIAGSNTLTLPAATTTLVGLTTTDTLTNKTLTAPTINTGALGNASTATTQAAGTNNTTLATTGYADRIGVQQVLTQQTGAVTTGTTVLPADNSIPQQTEGDQYMARAITPKSATSTLIVDVVFFGAHTVLSTLGVALFRDATAAAVAVAGVGTSGGTLECITLRYVVTSGSVSSTEFRVRAGGSSAGTTTFNGVGGASLFGALQMSSITVTEVGI